MNPPWKCVRFAPTEFEIFDEFLKPEVEKNEAELQYSLIRNFDLYENDPLRAVKGLHDFFATNNYWFFVVRGRAGRNSLLADRRIRINPDRGKWLKFGKTRHILRGAKNLGCVQTFDYVKNNLKTGWRQHEYTPAVEGVKFQTTVVSHLFYDQMLDQTGENHDDGEEQNLNGLLNDGEDQNLNGLLNGVDNGVEQNLNGLLSDGEEQNLNDGVDNVENLGEEQNLNNLLNDGEEQNLNNLLNDGEEQNVNGLLNVGEEQNLNALLNDGDEQNVNDGVDNVENLGGEQNLNDLLNDGEDQNLNGLLNGVNNGEQNLNGLLDEENFGVDAGQNQNRNDLVDDDSFDLGVDAAVVSHHQSGGNSSNWK